MIGLLYMLTVCTPSIVAAETMVIDQEQSIPMNELRSSTFSKSIEVKEQFEAKTENERQQLPKDEQELVNDIEQYLMENANPKARNFGSTVNRLISALVFDVTVKKDNTVIDIAKLFGLIGGSEESEWFDKVSGKSERY